MNTKKFNPSMGSFFLRRAGALWAQRWFFLTDGRTDKRTTALRELDVFIMHPPRGPKGQGVADRQRGGVLEFSRELSVWILILHIQQATKGSYSFLQLLQLTTGYLSYYKLLEVTTGYLIYYKLLQVTTVYYCKVTVVTMFVYRLLYVTMCV